MKYKNTFLYKKNLSRLKKTAAKNTNLFCVKTTKNLIVNEKTYKISKMVNKRMGQNYMLHTNSIPSALVYNATKKPLQSRMGKGKGKFDHKTGVIKAGDNLITANPKKYYFPEIKPQLKTPMDRILYRFPPKEDYRLKVLPQTKNLLSSDTSTVIHQENK